MAKGFRRQGEWQVGFTQRKIADITKKNYKKQNYLKNLKKKKSRKELQMQTNKHKKSNVKQTTLLEYLITKHN